MPRYNRIGTCNRCGLCCGAESVGPFTPPDRRSPFPKNFPWAYRHLSQAELDARWPHLSLSNIDRFLEQNQSGTVKLKGNNFPWCIKIGEGLQKDVSPGNDGSVTEPQCPFLMDDPGDGTRPCGLVGTRGEPAFTSWCEQEPTFPRDEAAMLEWVWRYGEGSTDGTFCSYTWELIPE